MKARLIAAFWWFSDKFSIRMKIMGIALCGIFLLGLLATVQTVSILNKTMSENLEKQGIAIARDVAARSIDYIYTNNLYALFELVEDTLVNNSDVSYIMLLDVTGKPLVHTFSQGIPRGLIELNHVNREERYNVLLFETEEGIIKDIAAPIFEGRAGTIRVGMSYHGITAAVIEATKKLFGSVALISFFGIISAVILTMALTRPVQQLVQATKEVAAGNYQVKVPEWWSKDEFGHLTSAFNHMTQELFLSNQELKRFSQEIIKHNKELAAYNAVIKTAATSLDLEKIAQSSLQELLQILSLSHGAILILDQSSEKFALVFHGKKSGPINKLADVPIKNSKIKECLNRQAPVVVAKKEFTRAFIPLKATNKIVGMLVIVGLTSDLSHNKIDFLLSVGSQIGLAVENALLWNEVKHKDEIRTQLLQKLITAQEDERKRIARELHDETSQSLSSFLLGLKLIEGSKDLEQVKERTGELRELVSQTLNDIHNLALELRPTILDDLGLLAAVERYIASITEKTGIEIDLQVLGLEKISLRPEVETAVYRIIQEALTNVVKYAQAESISILVERQGSHLIVIIEDDGIGFDLNKLQEPSLEYKHLGIFGMEERASIVGGSFSIESEPGIGTTVYFRLPLEEVA